eukprot:scaffold99561_cov51-Phaeocystis_antarctica.AAC.2
MSKLGWGGMVTLSSRERVAERGAQARQQRRARRPVGPQLLHEGVGLQRDDELHVLALEDLARRHVEDSQPIAHLLLVDASRERAGERGDGRADHHGRVGGERRDAARHRGGGQHEADGLGHAHLVAEHGRQQHGEGAAVVPHHAHRARRDERREEGVPAGGLRLEAEGELRRQAAEHEGGEPLLLWHPLVAAQRDAQVERERLEHALVRLRVQRAAQPRRGVRGGEDEQRLERDGAGGEDAVCGDLHRDRLGHLRPVEAGRVDGHVDSRAVEPAHVAVRERGCDGVGPRARLQEVAGGEGGCATRATDGGGWGGAIGGASGGGAIGAGGTSGGGPAGGCGGGDMGGGAEGGGSTGGGGE